MKETRHEDMKKRILTSCICLCAIGFLGFSALYLYPYVAGLDVINDRPHVGIGHAVQVAIINRWGGNLAFYNGGAPYLGDIISFDHDKNISVKGVDGPGIYVRIIKNVSVGKTWWTFMVRLWYPIAISGILLFVCVITRFKMNSTSQP